MYKRIIIVVASALFALLALLAVVITDLYDQDYPLALGVESKIHLDYSESEASITDAFTTLEELDGQLDLGLLKIAPDLANDSDGKVYVSLNDKELPSEFTWFSGNNKGKIVTKDRLANSYPDGFYQVTGNLSNLEKLKDTLTEKGVQVTRIDASIMDSLWFVVWEKGFLAAVLAAFALIAALALFWLSLRARGRALRVLSGSPTFRIQMQDLAGFGGALFISAVVVAILAAGYVGIVHDWLYVSTFSKALILLQVTVIAVSLLVAFIMSATAWPNATMLATRQPPVKSLRSAAIVIQAVTFLLVVAAAGPAWTAYKQSSIMAEEMAQWKLLADQVAIAFATEGDAMSQTERMIGEMVKEAEAQELIALSYTYMPEQWPGVNFGEYAAFSFVNERWLDIMTADVDETALTSVPIENIPESLFLEIQEEIDFLSRDGVSDEVFSQFQFMKPKEGLQLPVSPGGGGERLFFGDDILVVVLPSVYGMYNDASLTSMASSSNITFSGVTATQKLLEDNGLDVRSLRKQGIDGELRVVYLAEDGILQAQYAEYVVWLLNLSLIALVIAFTVAAAISALITALLQAKRDFPLRLAGRSWILILQSRVAKEFLVGALIVMIVALFQQPEVLGAIGVVTGYGLVIIPLCHFFAAQWCFNGVSKRRI